METRESWKVKLAGGSLAVVSIVGTATVVEGAVMRSAPVLIAGLAMSMAFPAAWVLWVMVDMLVWLRRHLRRRRPP